MPGYKPGKEAKLAGPRRTRLQFPEGRSTKRTPSPGSDDTGASGASAGLPERGACRMAEAEGSSPLLLQQPPPPPRMAEVETPTESETDMKRYHGSGGVVMDVERSRFPYCVVWTPIPVLT